MVIEASNESERLARLREYCILDTPAEPLFDLLVHLATSIFDTPMAILTFVDDRRQWFKARAGIEIAETPKEVAFCAHTVSSGAIFVVENAAIDPRFADNPFVTGEPFVRFYAGSPIRTAHGSTLGSFAILDRAPRQLDHAGRERLDGFSRLAMELLDARLKAKLVDAIPTAIAAAVQGRIISANRALVERAGGVVPAEVEHGGVPLETRAPPAVTEFIAGSRRIRFESMARSLVDLGEGAAPVELYLDLEPFIAAEQHRVLGQKMEAIGALAGGIAHDFNNLLTVIRGCADYIADGLRENDPLREDAEEIRGATDRAAALTRQLLTFSRRELRQPRAMRIKEIVDATEPLLRRSLPPSITLATHFGAEDASVLMDPGQLQQLLMNLVINAREAIHGEGRITISVGETHAYESNAPRDFVVVTVIDDGRGMSRELQARIFEPFFTTKELGRGTGLGLSTVYGIVNQAGGRLEVESAPGEGSTFRVYLPKLAAPAEPVEKPMEQPLATPGGQTVLLVEDEPALRQLVQRALEHEGYVVRSAENAEQALAAAAQLDTIDLLLSDVVLPTRSGPEIAAELERSRPGLRVLFVSGYAAEEELRRKLSEGGAPLLQKPFGMDELVREVRRIFSLGSADPRA